MFDVGDGELLLIILVILLLFGPEKLPEFTRTINKGLKKVKQAQSQFQSQINEIQNEINSSLDVDEKIPTAEDFKPIPLNDMQSAEEHETDENIAPKPMDEAETSSQSKKDNPKESDKEQLT